MFWSLMTVGVDVDWLGLMKEGPNVFLISDPVMLIPPRKLEVGESSTPSLDLTHLEFGTQVIETLLR